jgi:hypothetical protein
MAEPVVAKSAAAPVAAALKADPEAEGHFADADVYKGFKKMRKKLGKKVLAGTMTVDEARAKMGRQFAQKSADDLTEELVTKVNAGIMSIDEARARLNLPPWGTPESGAVPARIPRCAPPSTRLYGAARSTDRRSWRRDHPARSVRASERAHSTTHSSCGS